MKLFSLILFFLSVLSLNAQQVDTVSFNQRTGGKIDSLDFSFSFPISLFPGGALNVQNTFIDAGFVFNTNGLQNFALPSSIPPHQFSALPHLGFSYSFGSSGLQYVHCDYQQLFKKSLFNLTFNRSSANGFLRNSSFLNNDLTLRLERKSDFIDNSFTGKYENKVISLNGGVTNDTFIEVQGVNFLPVQYEDAASSFKIASLDVSNYYHLKADSAVNRKMGIQSNHLYTAIAREYINSSDLGVANYDTLATRDQYRFASIQNGIGIYYKTKKLVVNGLVNHRYWDYQNLGLHRDSVEINLTSDLLYQSLNYSFQNKLYLNVIGAGQEFYNKSNFSVRFQKVNLNANVSYSQLWPIQFQRFYYANAYNYKLSSPELQTKLEASLKIQVDLKEGNNFSIEAKSYTMKNNYFFIDSMWRNDTLTSILMNTFTLGGSVHYKQLYFQPRIGFNVVNNASSFLPSFTSNARFFIKGKLFKAKKMEGVLGFDLGFVKSYKSFAYNSDLDVFYFSSSSQTFSDYFTVGTFFGFEIGEFRFYTRLENLNYFATNIRNQSVIGYPVPPTIVRLGVTWDFFN